LYEGTDLKEEAFELFEEPGGGSLTSSILCVNTTEEENSIYKISADLVGNPLVNI